MSFNMYIKLNLSNENKQLGNKQYGKLENENNINKVDNHDTNNFKNWNNMNKQNIKKMKNIWGNLSKNNIKIVGNGVNNSATVVEQKAILDEVQIMVTNSLSKNDKSFIQKVIPGIMRVLTNIKDSSSESLNNIFEKITKGYSISELEKIISFLEKFLSTFGYNLPHRRSISSYTKNKTGGSNESINIDAVKYMGLFSILLSFLYFLYKKIEKYPYINPINNNYDPYRFPKSNNERGMTKKNKNGSKKNGTKVHFNNSNSKLVNQKISVEKYEKENPKGFKENDIVIYKGKEEAKIVSVHQDDKEPYFTIRTTDGKEFQTNNKHISHDWSPVNYQKSRTSYQKFYNNNTGKDITFRENTDANLYFLKKMQNNYHSRGLIG